MASRPTTTAQYPSTTAGRKRGRRATCPSRAPLRLAAGGRSACGRTLFGHVERRAPYARAQVGAGSVLEQDPGAHGVAGQGGLVKRGPAAAVATVGIGPCPQQRHERRGVAPRGRCDQWGLGVVGSARGERSGGDDRCRRRSEQPASASRAS